jgi:large subunit ribosomal protein L17
MRHRVDHRKLGRTSEHRASLLRNLVISLIEHGRIQTSVPKAKEARRLAEKCITIAKKAALATDPAVKLHFQRLALSELHNITAVKKLFSEVAPKYAERAGGYTRIYKAGFRLGDRSPIALFELV